MDNELKQKIKEGEKERKKYLMLIHLGEMLKSFGRRIIGNDMGEWRITSIIVRIFIVVSLFGMGLDIVPVLIIYVVLHIVVYLGGKILSSKFTDKIRQFEAVWVEIYNNYFANRASSEHIVLSMNGPYVDCRDGVKIDDRGMVHADITDFTADIYMYVLKNWGDGVKFSELKASSANDTVILNKNIASVEFNQKYGVVTDAENEVESVKYFAPARVVKILKTSEIEKFHDIHMRKKTFRARTEKSVERPEVLNVYGAKNMKKYFEAADKYCSELKSMADEIHKDYLKIAFLHEK